MSLLLKRDLGDTSSQLTPPRGRSYGSVTVSSDSALRMSAVWACLRLRADLISTLPVQAYREVATPDGGSVQVTVPSTPFLTDPGQTGYGISDWLYASQIELDRSGNAFGIIRQRDGLGFPSRVDLVANSHVQVRGNGPTITEYHMAGTAYDPRDIWHERQFPVAGVPLGLSPVAYAAMSVATYLSAAQFAVDWFAGGAIPSGQLQNTAKTIDPKEAIIAKDRFKAAVAARDLFVTGADWKYDMISVAANESQFLETMAHNATDVCRFFGVPADMIDADGPKAAAKITYGNITQRNLQLLIMHLGPAITRREKALSTALPRPRFVRLDEQAMLRMDPASLNAMWAAQIAARTLAPSEARALNNLPPFTPDQEDEFARLFPGGGPTAPSPAAAPADPAPADSGDTPL